MKVSEKSLELNVGAEILTMIRGPWGMPKAYLRGLTQREEKQEGVDFFVQLSPTSRIFAFQFKAPKGRAEQTPYRYTLNSEQHDLLYTLAGGSPSNVFYVLPYYVTHTKLRQDVPNLIQDTWLLPISPMLPSEIFGGRKTRTIRCESGIASVNPQYKMQRLAETRISIDAGIPANQFALWYKRLRHADVETALANRRSPWLVRGLRVIIVEANSSGV